ncbi:MAG TPA: DUF4160 domain-containing protein [Pirellulales bacterium]|jgi:hypothetical protein|nr:DUF4160 domain-containing protein [Pirellulales bacterium]
MIPAEPTTTEVECVIVPTVLRVGRYRFFFFSNEGTEPPHIHVKAGEHEAKFWLDPVELAANYAFNVRELGQIEQIVADFREELLETWNEYFVS